MSLDPRFLRSQRRLRTAILELAAGRSVETIGVAELCRAAGVTRDTFYRHAETPVALLVAALGERFEAAAAEHQDSGGGVRAFASAERAVLEHVLEHREVYRAAIDPVLLAPLRAALETVIAEVLVAHLRRYPGTLPEGVEADDEEALALVAGYAAAGTIGAIERWVQAAAPDVDRGVRLILAASPGFWFAAENGPV